MNESTPEHLQPETQIIWAVYYSNGFSWERDAFHYEDEAVIRFQVVKIHSKPRGIKTIQLIKEEHTIVRNLVEEWKA